MASGPSQPPLGFYEILLYFHRSLIVSCHSCSHRSPELYFLQQFPDSWNVVMLVHVYHFRHQSPWVETIVYVFPFSSECFTYNKYSVNVCWLNSFSSVLFPQYFNMKNFRLRKLKELCEHPFYPSFRLHNSHFAGFALPNIPVNVCISVHASTLQLIHFLCFFFFLFAFQSNL